MKFYSAVFLLLTKKVFPAGVNAAINPASLQHLGQQGLAG